MLFIKMQLTQRTDKFNYPVAVKGEIFSGNKLRTDITFQPTTIRTIFVTIPTSLYHLCVYYNYVFYPNLFNSHMQSFLFNFFKVLVINLYLLIMFHKEKTNMFMLINSAISAITV